MSRKRTQQSIDPTPLAVVLLVVLLLNMAEAPGPVFTFGALVALALALTASVPLALSAASRARHHRARIEEIDTMTGVDFERYLKWLLAKRGYRDVTLTETFDLGVDVIAIKDGERWAIQAKRHRHPVGLDAVRQVVAAKDFYGCDRTMVITNSRFTPNAHTIARSNGCILIDRPQLISLILAQPSHDR